MTEVTKRAWATINRNALKKNLAQVRIHCPDSKIIPVIKSNAYGHGVAEVASVFSEAGSPASMLAVATLAEALQLHELDTGLPILLLGGFINAEELALCLDRGIEPVLHSGFQVQLLLDKLGQTLSGQKHRLWLKLNTGMNRLGMSDGELQQAWQQLHGIPGIELVLMSHLAWADAPEQQSARDFTESQLQRFGQCRQALVDALQAPVPGSFAASAGILGQPASHHDYVRPGIMLYGSSPLNEQTGEELGLQPVMTLSARLMAINEVAAGESIGYGATYTCKEPTRVGVVSIGYGDGYPRAASNGTPVLVKTAGGVRRTRLVGRVSMDMITIELTGIDGANINDEVVLWGEGLCADEVARCAGTIAYELFCQVTPRVQRFHV
jgi:alanine racemase